jgi:hypothetical protein
MPPVETCQTGSGDSLCIALKYVAYTDPTGKPVITEAQAEQNLVVINQIWKTCHLGFKIDRFITINPNDHRLAFRTANLTELDAIRSALGDDNSLLIATTGRWDRRGSLGASPANAWTAMPGGPPYGSILEADVGTYSYIIAHELGHYMSLSHVKDADDLMNPIIYSHSIHLTDDQCQAARGTISKYWSRALR